MSPDQAKAIETLKAKYPRRDSCGVLIDYNSADIQDAIDEAVSISRASQGSRATEGDVEHVAQVLHKAHYERGRGIAPSYDLLNKWEREMWAFSARAVIAALSPPATPQAPEDVRERAICVIYEAVRILRNDARTAVVALERAHLLATPVTVTRPLAEWHEDMGDVVWWFFPMTEAPFVGSPLGDDWPDYHTH